MVIYIFLSYLIRLANSDYPQNDPFDITHPIDFSIFTQIHILILGIAKIRPNHFSQNKNKSGRTSTEYVKLTVFKGREAKLNRTIFLILGKKEPQTTRALFKAVTQIRSLKNTSYSTVNKRVRNLEELGFLKKVIVKQRLGGITNFYELRPKAYLSKFFDSASIEDLIKQTNDKTALIVLGTLIGTK